MNAYAGCSSGWASPRHAGRAVADLAQRRLAIYALIPSDGSVIGIDEPGFGMRGEMLPRQGRRGMQWRPIEEAALKVDMVGLPSGAGAPRMSWSGSGVSSVLRDSKCS